MVLILGVLAGVAAPRLFDATDEASVNATAQHLIVIAEAAELCFAQTGEWPGNQNGAILPPELAPYLRDNPFASPCPIGGVFDWDANNGGHRARIKIYGMTPNDPAQLMLDSLLDDGDLATGQLIALRPEAIVYIVAE